jgi:WD40 repeat protein
MDTSDKAQFVSTGHEHSIGLWKISDLTKIYDIQTGSDEVQIKTQIDPTSNILISSSTNKTVTIYDLLTGVPILQCCPGEITTAMCLSQNFRHLITTSDKGVIYIWKLPKSLTSRLTEARLNPNINTELTAPAEKDFDFNLDAKPSPRELQPEK